MLSVIVLVVTAAAAAARGEAVVLSSTAPGLEVGHVVGAGESLSLPADSQTVLLLSSGQVLSLTGPHDGVVEPAGGVSAPAASGGGDGGRGDGGRDDWRQPDLSALGGARDLGHPPVSLPAGPLLVEAGRSGVWCADPGAELRIAAPERPAALHLEDAATGADADIVWPPLHGAAPWPAALPVRDGTVLRARWSDRGPPLQLTFRRPPAPPDGAPSPAARLILWQHLGCRQQAEAQLRALGRQWAPFALYLATDRGRTPRYAVGEPVTVVLRSNRPSRLSCFLLQGQETHALFSGPGNAGAGTGEGMAVGDGAEIRLTADRLPIDITAPPPHEAELRCYGVTGSLPPASQRVARPAALPDGEPPGRRLDALFSGVPEGDLAMASLFITIE